MWISHEKFLIKHFGNMYRDFCFVLDFIQMIINIVTMCYKPNINLELHKRFLKKILQSKMENDDARTFIETFYNQNFIQIKNHMKWIHFYHQWMKHCEVNTWSWWNLIQVDFNNHAWIWWLHNFHLSHLGRKHTRVPQFFVD